MALNIMVEGKLGAADNAIRELTDAVHAVRRCHEPGAPAAGYRGIDTTSACPLESHVVDVALTGRPRLRSQPAPQEDGVRWALMHPVLFVVAGPAVLDPYTDFATMTLGQSCDVVDGCEAAASAQLVARARHVRVAVGSDRAASTAVSVTCRSGTLRVHVEGLTGISHQERQAAVVRAVGALWHFGRTVPTVDLASSDIPT
ncbi:MAG: hypothetical protein ACLPVY_18770 [Acidimicrobiia bacterium]